MTPFSLSMRISSHPSATFNPFLVILDDQSELTVPDHPAPPTFAICLPGTTNSGRVVDGRKMRKEAVNPAGVAEADVIALHMEGGETWHI